MVEYGHCIVGEQIIKIEHAGWRAGSEAFRYHGCILASAGTDAVCEILRRASGVGEAQLKKYRDGGTESQEDGMRHKAAIASRLTAEIYGLDVLEEGIQDNKQNATRFIIVTGNMCLPERRIRLHLL